MYIEQGQWNLVRRVRNCAPTFQPNSNQPKLSEEKRNFENWSKIDRDRVKNVNCTPTYDKLPPPLQTNYWIADEEEA